MVTQFSNGGSRGGGVRQAALAAAVGVTLVGGGNAMAALVAHYDAGQGVYTNGGALAQDGEAVREWHDQAALGGNQLAQNGSTTIQPSYQSNAINGLPAINFGLNPIPGSTDNPNGLVMGNGWGGADATTELDTKTVSWSIVFQNPYPDDDRTVFSARFNDGNPVEDDRVIYDNFLRTYYESGYRISHARDTSLVLQGTFTDANDAEDLGWMVLTAVWDGDAGVFTEYVNGVQMGQNTDAQNTLTDFFFDRYRIGANPAGSSGSRFEGLIAELLIWNHALGDAERVSTEVGLGQKYGLAVVPEPASLALLGCGAIAAMSRRRDA